MRRVQTMLTCVTLATTQRLHKETDINTLFVRRSPGCVPMSDFQEHGWDREIESREDVDNDSVRAIEAKPSGVKIRLVGDHVLRHRNYREKVLRAGVTSAERKNEGQNPTCSRTSYAQNQTTAAVTHACSRAARATLVHLSECEGECVCESV